MSDTDVWGLGGPIASPAATDRSPWATGPGAGGFSLRGDFVYRDAAGAFQAGGPIRTRYTPGDSRAKVIVSNTVDGTSVAPAYSEIQLRGGGADADVATISGYNSYVNFAETGLIISLRNPSNVHAELFRFTGGGVFRPAGNGTQNLASSSFPWNNSYFAVSPTITSDAKSKVKRPNSAPTDKEIEWARSIRPLAYRVLRAVEEKGEDGARIHWGVIAQEVWQAGIDAGIADPFHYGFLGRDPKFDLKTQTVEVRQQRTRSRRVTEREIAMRDGRAVMSSREVEVIEPLFVEHVVTDEDGQLVMVERPVIDASGAVVMQDTPIGRMAQLERVPMIHLEPDMETVEVEQEVQAPAFDENGEPDFNWSIRYDELIMFVWSCGAFAAAA